MGQITLEDTETMAKGSDKFEKTLAQIENRQVRSALKVAHEVLTDGSTTLIAEEIVRLQREAEHGLAT